ncbi:MAG: VanZ family protein [Gammaproteobacteria bacterium]|nr:VanZ family protein [Gammaproteobacteria bacterium]
MQHSSEQVPAKHLLLAASWVLLLISIALLSIFGRNLQYWVADTIGYTAAAWIIGILILACISAFLLWLNKNSYRIPWKHLFWFIPIFLIMPLFLERVEERLHFLTFGLCGALAIMLFNPRLAFSICLVVSGADEVLQYYLPDRVGDWRDVLMNSIASIGAASFVLFSRNYRKQGSTNTD